MAGTKEIQNRIQSVQQTQQITNAMYLIASMKMRKAKRELDGTRPYFDAVSTEIKRIFRTAGDVKSRYFYPPDGSEPLSGPNGLLVITADKGLAGAYNQNVLKKAEAILKEKPDTKLFVVGEYGRQYFLKRRIPVEQNFLYTAQNPNFTRAREICLTMLGPYDEGKLKKLYILYTDLRNGMLTEPIYSRLLPFHRAAFHTDAQERAVKEPFEFLPSVEEVLNRLVPSYVSGNIYSALVDSFCSEQQARMSAMKSAGDNAAEMLDELSREYNHIRQANITQEITELSAPKTVLRNN
ncbi:MAG: ATP synthase F1 subunit gamma [Firmicutes bacterium]|nr:ATP synthase F1 subunit gamma [Bacillota bacterium]